MSATRSFQGLAASDPQQLTFDVERQRADTINNVGRDQYNSHHYALRIEPMRRRARVLLRVGGVLVVSALAVQLLAVVLFGAEIGDFVQSIRDGIAAQDPQAKVDWPPFGVLLLIPAAALVGLLGLALILLSVSMRRRARREELSP